MRYVLKIAYDGTAYAGWQRQKNALSVQEALEKAVETALGFTVKTTASGRTDAGVHAAGGCVDTAHLPHMVVDIGIVALADLPAQREADARRVKTRRRHLIEERREGMIVVAVHDGDIVAVGIDMFHKIQAGESSAYHHYPLFQVVCIIFCTHNVHSFVMCGNHGPQGGRHPKI